MIQSSGKADLVMSTFGSLSLGQNIFSCLSKIGIKKCFHRQIRGIVFVYATWVCESITCIYEVLDMSSSSWLLCLIDTQT